MIMKNQHATFDGHKGSITQTSFEVPAWAWDKSDTASQKTVLKFCLRNTNILWALLCSPGGDTVPLYILLRIFKFMSLVDLISSLLI